MRSQEALLASSSSSSSMAAIELIVLYAWMKNTELKMAPLPPSGLTSSLDRKVTEVEMMKFESVSRSEEEAEEALSC